MESSCSYSFTTQCRHWYLHLLSLPSPSFHYAWYGGTGFLGVGHPGHLVHPLGLYFLCLGIIQSCLPASPVFPYLGLIFTQINLCPNTSLCTNCTFFGGKSFELGNIYIVWHTSRGQIFSWSCNIWTAPKCQNLPGLLGGCLLKTPLSWHKVFVKEDEK